MPEQKYSNGDRYTGDSKDGKRHGEGIYTDKNGNTFQGKWSNDMLIGNGVYSGADGKYVGQWLASMKHGKGTFTWPNGDVYEGDWLEDNINGMGNFKWKNGKVYNGQWCDGLRTGVGSLTFPDGSKYDGQWKCDQCHGKGRFTEANGVYEGDWKDNKKHGHGIYNYKDGRKYIGNWVDDLKTSGFVWLPSGEAFKVSFDASGNVISQEETSADNIPGYKAPKPPAPRGDEQAIYERAFRAGRLEQSPEDQGSQPWKVKKVWDYSQSIPYEELKLPSCHNRPEIDAMNREKYLTEAEFQKVFKISTDEYQALPQWRRNVLKKQVRLF
eukprot:NODE_2708_length_1114_cov_54.650456_g2585_i0.p1 GENE.NODE_2708_length_1114_cov_54.650456_g2585_i0~~NODE_2708_length_1114_cov_54.650456_g2585_i0.p1  ORF type:complete len:342 (-),score=97.88 NODE_2708_length_1114_cov_54.650456_g2585_i0:89-1066(-)